MITNGGPWWHFFLQHVQGIYVPLTNMSFALEYRLVGENPLLFHFDNIILHILVVLLVFRLAMRLGLSKVAALAGALLFAVHPMRVESVAWITERKDVLYAFFYLLAIDRYLNYQHKPSVWKYVVVFALGFLSVLSKSMALSLPLILLLIDWYRQRKITFNIILEKVPLTFAVASVAYVTYLFNERNPIVNIGESFLTWVWCFTFYFLKFAWPFDLSPVYAPPLPISILNWNFIVAISIFIGLGYLVWRWRKDRLFLCAMAYYVLSIFFLLRFDFSWDTNVVADRFMYLPSLGFCWWLGVKWEQRYLLESAKGSFAKKRLMVVSLVILAVLTLKTFSQSMIWGDQLRFWNYTIEKCPKYVFAYGNRANTYKEMGDYKKAIENYSKAIEMDSTYRNDYYNRGITYLMLKDYDKALNDFNEVVRLDPSFAMAYLSRSIILTLRANYKLALYEATIAKELGAKFPDDYLPYLKSQEANDVHNSPHKEHDKVN